MGYGGVGVSGAAAWNDGVPRGIGVRPKSVDAGTQRPSFFSRVFHGSSKSVAPTQPSTQPLRQPLIPK